MLNGYVAATLDALRADGIECTPDELAWLVELRWRCDRPDFREGIAPPRGFPLIIETMPDVELWPLHALAETWFRMAGTITEDLRTDVYLFAHTRSQPGDVSLASLQTADAIREAVGAWRCGLPLHDENEAALVRLCRLIDGYTQPDVLAPGQDEPKDEASPEDMDSRCIRMLCESMPGTTPTYWRSEISVAEMDALMRARRPEAWAEAPRRKDSIANYLNAVKWIRHAHGKD
jgi:hypothetical protein